ncbi:hypothetical protein GQ55_5G225800 [Panicum hallii var. hallii]|uniref:Uncharacterized protein n=1 Tax=Panicum hallii var. hallii TaxID=1504633 RepID=A0A2T7DJ44_9POAL|nr:hypothetical protein GQ55_5G225800 [Panicum hallii var. hallii]
MEAEAFPIRFTKGIRSYWRRRDYKPADGTGAAASRGRRRHRLVRLGDGSGSGPRPWAVRLGGMFRVKRRRGRAPAPAPAPAVAKAPMRVLGRIRDAYVDVMLGAAKTQPAAARALPTAADALWQKRVPTRRSSSKAQQKADELGQRLIMEMYKSVLASRSISGMLHASVAR